MWRPTVKYTPRCLLLLATLVLFSACSDMGSLDQKRAREAKNAGPGEPIRIGAVAPWEKLTALGQYREGLELALEEINAQHVLDRPFELVWKDDKASLSRGRAVAQELAEDSDIMAVVGHYNSFIAVPVSLMYEHYGLLMITATATATDLTSREGLELIFRNIPNDRQVASQLADFSHDQGYERIIVLNQDNAFGNSLANAFELRAGKIGLNVVDRRTYDTTSGASHFRSMFQAWTKYYRFDAIFLAGVVPQAAEFIALAREMGVKAPIIGGDGLDTPKLLEIAGEHANDVIVGTYFHPKEPNAKAQEFVRAFTNRYGKKPDAWAAQAYDTLHLLATAMRQAQSTTPRAVARALRTMDPFQGVTGHTEFNKQGDVINRSITTKIVQDQQFRYLGLNASHTNANTQ